MKQLKMIRYSGSVVTRELPQGYSFAFFKDSSADIDAWCEICREADMVTSQNNGEVFDKVMRSVKGIELERDLFFVVDSKGRRVATSALIHNKEKNSGYLHMVAAIPDVRNMGIGHAMLSFATSLAQERGIDYCVLTTDDYRLAAIKNYLCGGFRPVLYAGLDEEMRKRWAEVAKKLDFAIREEDFIVEN